VASWLSVLFAPKGNRLTLTDYQSQTEEWLFIISHQFFGWPGRFNRWWYPEVRRWDKDEDGYYSIPAFITFYVNPGKYLDVDDRHRFAMHLRKHLPGPWYFYWEYLQEGYVHVERRPITMVVEVSEYEAEFHQIPTVE
jgi:hypothetical protein